MKVATTRAELHKIQHKSIQVVAEGIGLENCLIRNVAAFRNFQCKKKKLKHFAVTHSLNLYQDELDLANHYFYAQKLSMKNGENNGVLVGVPFLSPSRAQIPPSPFNDCHAGYVYVDLVARSPHWLSCSSNFTLASYLEHIH